MLFHEIDDGPQHPQTCSFIDPLLAAKENRKKMRSRGQRLMHLISEEDAAKACQVVLEDDLANCVFDVLGSALSSV